MRSSPSPCPRLDRLRGGDLPGGLRLAEARSPLARMRGLAWLDALPEDYALLFRRCHSVHTYGMRFALDVIFLDPRGTVVRVARDVPRRRHVSERGARSVVETRAGVADRFIAAGLEDAVRG